MIALANLYTQYLTIKEEIDEAIACVIRTSNYINGDAIHAFEEAFAAYTGATYCIAVGNGTDALEIVLEACALYGSRVVLPAMTAAPTIEAVMRTGGAPILCDIGYDGTLAIEEATHKAEDWYARAFLPVHLYGAPADMDQLLPFAKQRDMLVIEDCAQAHGTRINGQHVGTFGIAGCFSFYPGKNLGAYGDAGAIITDNTPLAVKCRKLRNHGRTTKYRHEIVGRNSRMDGIQAAILTVKLRHLDKWLALRRRNAQIYNSLLEGRVALPEWLEDSVEYSYHQYPILVHQRDKLAQWLRERDIATGIHYPFALPDQPPYQALGQDVFPVAREFADQELSLPIHEGLSEAEVERVAVTILEFYEHV